MRNVARVGEVEQVVIGTDLEVVFALGEDVEIGGDELDVAFAEEAGGADGAGQEAVGRNAVRGENELVGMGLVRGIC